MSLVAGTSTRIAISHAHSNILINELLDRQDSALLAFTLVFMSLYKKTQSKVRFMMQTTFADFH